VFSHKKTAVTKEEKQDSSTLQGDFQEKEGERMRLTSLVHWRELSTKKLRRGLFSAEEEESFSEKGGLEGGRKGRKRASSGSVRV